MKPDAMIIDIDGVMAKAPIVTTTHDDAYDQWEAGIDTAPFNAFMGPIIAGIETTDTALIFMTARRELLRERTEAWLQFYLGHSNWQLLMGRDLDETGTQSKTRHTKAVLESYNVLCAIDDNPDNVVTFREFGIPTFHVRGGD